MPIVEAMACGVPVVATPSGGVREIVEDGVSGRLVPRGDADGLARVVSELLADRAAADRMAATALAEVVPRFTWDRAAAALLDQYRTLLGRGGRRSPGRSHDPSPLP
jgi:glycosyltransferase involved in cell wall biosynthesis